VCGRVTETQPERIVEAFEIAVEPPDLGPPRYNVSPSEAVPVVRLMDPRAGRRLDLLRWGLVPSWAKDPSIGSRLINARIETLTEKPVFREAFERRRCLVVADGFYEWQRQDKLKQPFHVKSAQGDLLAMAGLWDRVMTSDGEIVETFSIITKPAEGNIRELHDRMPAIVDRARFAEWLDPSVHDPEQLRAMLALPSPALETVAVNPRVNKPGNDGPECLEPAVVQPTLFG
jgi:putative SOS response-associated peptidase YedK